MDRIVGFIKEYSKLYWQWFIVPVIFAILCFFALVALS